MPSPRKRGQATIHSFSTSSFTSLNEAEADAPKGVGNKPGNYNSKKWKTTTFLWKTYSFKTLIGSNAQAYDFPCLLRGARLSAKIDGETLPFRTDLENSILNSVRHLVLAQVPQHHHRA